MLFSLTQYIRFSSKTNHLIGGSKGNTLVNSHQNAFHFAKSEIQS